MKTKYSSWQNLEGSINAEPCFSGVLFIPQMIAESFKAAGGKSNDLYALNLSGLQQHSCHHIYFSASFTCLIRDVTEKSLSLLTIASDG